MYMKKLNSILSLLFVLVTLFASAQNKKENTLSSFEEGQKSKYFEAKKANIKPRRIEELNTSPLLDSTLTYIHAQYIGSTLMEVDSVLNRKTYFNYDENGNLLQELGLWRESEGVYINSSKKEYSYDNNHNILSCAEFEWDAEGSFWDKDFKDEFEYNINNSKTLSIRYNGDNSTNEWKYGGKVVYEYNAENLQTQRNVYVWQSDAWVNSSKKTTIWNTSYHSIDMWYIWDNSDNVWNPDSRLEWDRNAFGVTNYTYYTLYDEANEFYEGYEKYEKSYDANGDLLNHIQYEWHESSQTWGLNWKHDYNYNVENNLTSDSSFHYSSGWNLYTWSNYTYNADNQLSICLGFYVLPNLNDYKIEYIYMENGKLSFINKYKWDDANEIWINSSKVEYDYDSNENQILYLKQNWDNTNELWLNVEKEEDTYDQYTNQTSHAEYEWNATEEYWYSDDPKIVYEFFNSSSRSLNTEGIVIRSKSEYWMDDNHNWLLYSKDLNHYDSGSTVDVSDFNSKNSCLVFPNPTKGILFVKSDNLIEMKIFNQRGAIVKTTSKSVIDLKDQAKGIYFVKVISKAGIFIEKIILE